MKWIVAGTRTINDQEYIRKVLDEYTLLLGKPQEVVTGDARGVDFWAGIWAKQRGFRTKVFDADWKRYGSAAGPIRNTQMADYVRNDDGSVLILIWDGKSRGSANMKRTAEKAGLSVFECIYGKKEKI